MLLTLRATLPVILLCAALACAHESTNATMTAAPLAPDVHSFARPAEARVTHIALDLHADFTARTLGGSATLTFDRRPDVRQLVLDTRDLEIRQVLDERQQPLTFRLQPPVEHLGQALVIALPATGERVVVQYRTRPDAAALQWLTPAQTSGRIHPYLYSQGQAILTRTWIPTQDSPAIRQTYEASITVPRPLSVVMSAEMKTPSGIDARNGRRVYTFKMDQPVPPYLIAIGIGDIAFRSLGPRTGVYAEPPMISRAAQELEDLEKMIAAAETLGGPYRWGRYDVLVLPPSFPFGGMENPRLTFATPTILAGDKSLVSLLAHELAHSWSGNLVTNATWGDFWLNEGFTTYFENRIMEALYGKDRALMLATLGRNELMREMADLPPADTKLSLDLKGRNPDDAVNSVAYEKGAALLRTIEEATGRDRFDPWLRGYFNRHAFTSITTQEFVSDLQDELIQGDSGLRDALNLPAWLDQPGLPANAAPVQSPAFAQVESEARRFAEGAPASSLAVSGWTPQQWQHLLEQLRTVTLSPAQLRDLDATFNLSASGNSEILFAWLRVAVARQYAPAVPAIERFLTAQGRRKFLRPLYEDLVQSPWGQPIAQRVYATARSSYHAVSTQTIDTIVK